MVRVGNDLIIIGGKDSMDDPCDSILKLSCNNQNCTWEIQSQKLKIARYSFVSLTVPDDFVTCDD